MSRLMTAQDCSIQLWTFLNLVKKFEYGYSPDEVYACEVDITQQHGYPEETLDRMIHYAEALMISLKTQPDISIHEWNEEKQCLQSLAYSRT